MDAVATKAAPRRAQQTADTHSFTQQRHARVRWLCCPHPPRAYDGATANGALVRCVWRRLIALISELLTRRGAVTILRMQDLVTAGGHADAAGGGGDRGADASTSSAAASARLPPLADHVAQRTPTAAFRDAWPPLHARREQDEGKSAAALSRSDRRARKRVLERHLPFDDHDSLDAGVDDEPSAKAAHFDSDASWPSTTLTSGLAVLSAQACNSAPSSADVAPSPVEADGTRRRQQLKEASQRCRKRQKHESLAYTTEINRLRQEIALLRSKFEAPALPSIEENRSASHHRFQMKRHLGFLKKKLSDHHCWLQSIRSLLASAPLFDFAVHLAKDAHRSSSQSAAPPSSMLPPDFKYLNEWREDCEQQKYSRVLMAQCVKDAVRASSQNTSNLLKQFTSQDAHFQRNFVSRGWTISTSAKNELLAFRCQRQFPHGVSAKDVAFKLWHSIQRDDILRTFVPIVQGSILVHESGTCSISRRLIQPTPHEPQQTSVTVESIAFVDGYNTEAWQISIQTIEDHYLCLLAAEKADEPASPMISPASVRAQTSADTEQPSSSKFKHNNQFVIAAQILQNQHGASVELAGCTQHDVPPAHPDEDASLDLLRYFASLLPVYEELHLTQGGSA